VNGELGDLLTGGTGSQNTLLELEDANAFVTSLDPDRTWFRYHLMMRDMLRLDLRRTRSPEIPQLHRRAGGWLAEHAQTRPARRLPGWGRDRGSRTGPGARDRRPEPGTPRSGRHPPRCGPGVRGNRTSAVERGRQLRLLSAGRP
jgi:hypothetical protein